MLLTYKENVHSTQMYIPLKPLFSRHKGIGVQFTDEPTGNLDSKSGKIVIDALTRINKENGKTIVMVTHDPQMASYCSRIILLKDGIILEELRNKGNQEAFYEEIIKKMAEL